MYDTLYMDASALTLKLYYSEFYIIFNFNDNIKSQLLKHFQFKINAR